MSTAKKYVVWNPGSRPGDFNFLCATQEHWTDSVVDAIQAARDEVAEVCAKYDPPMSRRVALEELGGRPVVYEITLRRVPYRN